MSSADEWVREWARKNKARLMPALERLRSGGVTLTDNGVDVTDEHRARLEEMVAELNQLIERDGGVDVGN